jgi:hypothetical protein
MAVLWVKRLAEVNLQEKLERTGSLAGFVEV